MGTTPTAAALRAAAPATPTLGIGRGVRSRHFRLASDARLDTTCRYTCLSAAAAQTAIEDLAVTYRRLVRHGRPRGSVVVEVPTRCGPGGARTPRGLAVTY